MALESEVVVICGSGGGSGCGVGGSGGGVGSGNSSSGVAALVFDSIVNMIEILMKSEVFQDFLFEFMC